MLYLLLILTPLLLLAYQEYKYAKIRKTIRHTKGPKPVPIIGNSLQLGKTPCDVLNFIFDNWYKYEKKNFRFWVAYYLNIMISEAKDVEFILSSTTLIAKSDAYDMLHPWLGEGLLTSKGLKWHKFRKMIAPSFHFKILQDFHEIMNQKSNKFMEKLRDAARNDEIFDFQEIVSYLTLDVICETAMGVDVNSMDDPESKFVGAVNAVCFDFMSRAFNPLKRKFSTYQFFPQYKEYCKNIQILQDFTNGVIEKRIENREDKQLNKNNDSFEDNEQVKPKMAFLDTLLTSTIDGKPLTMQEILEEVSTFIFTGHDTTTSAISFTIFVLSRHLAVQQKAFDEQQHVMGTNIKRDATHHELGEMKYLDLVIKETLRLYPSAPIVARLTEKEYNMNGKIIPPHTSLNIFIMALGYNEEFFPDPYLFKPDRFENEIPNPYTYVPFSAGKRNCIGQKFGLSELKIVVSKILRNFVILPPLDELASRDGYVCTKMGPYKNASPHKYDPVLSSVITLKSDNGILIRLKEREG